MKIDLTITTDSGKKPNFVIEVFHGYEVRLADTNGERIHIKVEHSSLREWRKYWQQRIKSKLFSCYSSVFPLK